MSDKNAMPATDSARDLKPLVHDDVTADFESDPKFVDSNPAESASSENLVQMRDTDDDEDSDDELEDEDEDEFEDDEDDDEDDVDEAEADDELDDDEEYEDDEDDEEDEDEDEDLEDDEDEVGASAFVLKRAA
jgi:hypothetical protein